MWGCGAGPGRPARPSGGASDPLEGCEGIFREPADSGYSSQAPSCGSMFHLVQAKQLLKTPPAENHPGWSIIIPVLFYMRAETMDAPAAGAVPRRCSPSQASSEEWCK